MTWLFVWGSLGTSCARDGVVMAVELSKNLVGEGW